MSDTTRAQHKCRHCDHRSFSMIALAKHVIDTHPEIVGGQPDPEGFLERRLAELDVAETTNNEGESR